MRNTKPQSPVITMVVHNVIGDNSYSSSGNVEVTNPINNFGQEEIINKENRQLNTYLRKAKMNKENNNVVEMVPNAEEEAGNQGKPIEEVKREYNQSGDNSNIYDIKISDSTLCDCEKYKYEIKCLKEMIKEKDKQLLEKDKIIEETKKRLESDKKQLTDQINLLISKLK